MAGKAKNLPSLDLLDRLFSYDPKSGVISRIFKTGRNVLLGPIIPTPQRKANGDKKYFQITIRDENGKDQKYYYHRVAWKIYTGEEPPDKLDHRDGDPWNNKIRNLRKATTSTNGFNRGMQRNNSSGAKGVTFHHGKYYVKITVNRKIIRLGKSASLEKAALIYKQAALKYHKRYAHD